MPTKVMASSTAAEDSESTSKLAALAAAAAELTDSKHKDEPLNQNQGDSDGPDLADLYSATNQQPNEATPPKAFEILDAETEPGAASSSPITESRTSPAETSKSLLDTQLTDDPSCPWKNRNDLVKLWKRRYAELLEYHAQHGNCNVPQRYPDNPELGRWVKDQRAFRRDNKLNQDRVKLLDQLGFQWIVKKPDDFWTDKFNALKKYKQKHGNTTPPREGEWKLLACWVDRQRRAGKMGKLTRERVNLLNGVEFVWDPRRLDDGEDEIICCDEVEPSSTQESSHSVTGTTSSVSMQQASNLSGNQAPGVGDTTTMCQPVMTSKTPQEHLMKGSNMMAPAARAQAQTCGMANYSMMHGMADYQMMPFISGQHPRMMGRGMQYHSGMSGMAMPGSTMEAADTFVCHNGMGLHPNMASAGAAGSPMHQNMMEEQMSMMAASDMQHCPNRMPTAMPGQASGRSESMPPFATQQHYQGMPGSNMSMHHSNMSTAGFSMHPNSPRNPLEMRSNVQQSSRSAQLRAMIAEEENQARLSRTQQMRAMLEQEERRVKAMRAIIEEEERHTRTHQLRAMLEEEEMRVGHMMNQGMKEYGYNDNVHFGMQKSFYQGAIMRDPMNMPHSHQQEQVEMTRGHMNTQQQNATLRDLPEPSREDNRKTRQV